MAADQLSPAVVAQLQELADLKAGVPSHGHMSVAGKPWRCTSPYCDRANDIRDEPQVGPNEGSAQAARYRRS